MIGLIEEEYLVQMICFCPKRGLIALQLDLQTMKQSSIAIWGQIINNQGDSKNELTHIAYDWPLWRKISLSDDLLLPQTRLDRSSAWFVDNETTISRGVRMTSQQSGGQQKWAYALDCIWLASLRRNISVRWFAFAAKEGWSLFSLICRLRNNQQSWCEGVFSMIRGTAKMSLHVQ